MDLISVIVPVYNVEKYLDACVESIVNQTYKNLEIILVDDGSSDNCHDMCDAWITRDARIRVIHKENGGLSDARNVGMREARGNYIGFVDSDDIIAPEMYENLQRLLADNCAEVSQCKMVQFSDMPFQGFSHNCKDEVMVVTPEEAVTYLLNGTISTTCPNILSKREVAISTEFDVGMINEDVMWTYRVLAKSSRTVITDEVYYAYYQRPGSIMNSSYSIKRFDALKALHMRSDSIRNDFPALFPVAERTYAGGCMYHYQLLCRLNKTSEFEEYKIRLHKMFCESDLKSVFSVTDLKYKLWYTMFRYVPNMTCKVRNILKIGI